jgi:hypothetical protein
VNDRCEKRRLIETAVHAGSFPPPHCAFNALSPTRSTRKTCPQRLPVSIRAWHRSAELTSLEEKRATGKRVEGVWGRGASSPPRSLFIVRRSRSDLCSINPSPAKRRK